MSERSGFFDARLVDEEYDRVYLAESFAAYFASFIGDGVFGGKLNSLQVIATANPSKQVLLRSGQSWIKGYWYENSADLVFDVPLADGVRPRKDILAIRLDFNERTKKAVYKEGVPSTKPVPPTLQRDADAWELQLAVVNVPAGALSIRQANIEDTRLDENVCGLVKGVVEQISTEGYLGQLQGFINDYIATANNEYGNFMGSLDDLETNARAYYDQLLDEFIEVQQRTENEFSNFLIWLSNTKLESTEEIQRLLDSLEGLLDPEPAAVLSERIRKIEEEQPTIELGTVEHNLKRYPHCQLYEIDYGCGVQRVGEGPAGGTKLIQIPTQYEMDDINNIRIATRVGYGVVQEINKVTEGIYAVVFTDKLTSVLIFLY